MDEGKHDLICLICRVLTSYKPPTLQPGIITEKVASTSLLSVKRFELEISQPQRRALTTTLWDTPQLTETHLVFLSTYEYQRYTQY